MAKKKRASKTPKKTKNIPLKAGAKATHKDKGAKFVTNVIAQGTGTGGPGSRGGKQFGGKGYKARKDKAPDSQPLGISDQLRALEQDKITRQRYKGGGSLAYGFPSNEGKTGSLSVARRENVDTFAQMLKVGIRDGLVIAEQKRKQMEAQKKAFNELNKRDEERSKNIPEKTITHTAQGVQVDREKLLGLTPQQQKLKKAFGKPNQSPREELTPQQKKLSKAFRPKQSVEERISDEGQKFKVIERRQDQLRRIVSVPEEQRLRVLGSDATARPQRAPVFDDIIPEPEGEEISTDESDFETSTIKDRYRATEGGSVKDRYFDSISRARRTEPRLEQPISNAERIRRLELRQFQVQTPAQIEEQRQRDLQQFQVGEAQVYTPVSNIRSRQAPRDFSRGANTNREVFGVPEVPRPPTAQEQFILDQQQQSSSSSSEGLGLAKTSSITKPPRDPTSPFISGMGSIPFDFGDLSLTDTDTKGKGGSIPSSSSSDSSGPSSQGGANRVFIPRRSNRQAQEEIDRLARRRLLRAQAERLDAERRKAEEIRKRKERQDQAEYDISVGDAKYSDFPEFYASSGIESPSGYSPGVLESDTSYISTDEMSEFGNRAVQRAQIRRARKQQQKEEREAIVPSLLDNVFTKALKTDRYRNRAKRGESKDRLPPDLKQEAIELEERIKQIKKDLSTFGIGRPDIAKAGTKKLQSGIKARLQELGLIGEQSTQLLLDELFVKSARLTQLRSKKFKSK